MENIKIKGKIKAMAKENMMINFLYNEIKATLKVAFYFNSIRCFLHEIKTNSILSPQVNNGYSLVNIKGNAAGAPNVKLCKQPVPAIL